MEAKCPCGKEPFPLEDVTIFGVTPAGAHQPALDIVLNCSRCGAAYNGFLQVSDMMKL